MSLTCTWFRRIERDLRIPIQVDNFYALANNGGVDILDDSLGIDWKIPIEKDTRHNLIKDFNSVLI